MTAHRWKTVRQAEVCNKWIVAGCPSAVIVCFDCSGNIKMQQIKKNMKLLLLLNLFHYWASSVVLYKIYVNNENAF